MTSPDLDIPAWHQATVLSERLALLRRSSGCDANKPVLDSELARRWRSQAPFTDASLFEQRLQADGLAEDDWRRVVAEPASTVRERAGGPPAFAPGFVAAFTQPPDIDVADILPEPESVSRRSRGTVGFIVAVEPLLKQARARLREGLRALVEQAGPLPFAPAVAEHRWLLDLPSELLALLDRTFALEMHVAGLQGLLAGDTPEQRYASFLQRLRDPAVVLAIFREYPVLAKYLAVCVDQWVAYGLEFFRHLIADWSAIRSAYCPSSDPGQLVSVETGAGDPHRQGRSVVLLRFNSGFRLVYKPKALAVDIHFQELVGWLNARGLEPGLRTLTVLDRGTYGWIEHVEPTSCDDEDAVRRFYRRQGALVLVAYMLGAMDFHFENLLAIGEHPVLIDLETLFAPYPRQPDARAAEGSLHTSVLRSGLLPHWMGSELGIGGVDISGIGTKPGQKTAVGMPTWEGEGTDALRFTRKIVELSGGHNRPTLEGVGEVDVVDYVEHIIEGFRAAYTLVVAQREALLAPGGPIAAFAHDEVRVIQRSTQRYAVLRYEARHPNILRDALDGDRMFDRLWREVAQTPSLARLIPSEREDLWRGDIPMFFTTPSETRLRDSMGRCIEGVIDQPSYEQVVRGIRGFGGLDLDRQVWFLRLALSTLDARVGGGRRPPRRAPPEQVAPLDRGRLLRAASAIGRRLGAVALADDELVYLGASPRGNRWVLAPMDAYLYQGSSGIALFLGYLGAVTGDEDATRLARATLEQAAQSMQLREAAQRSIGAFEGWGSLLYASTHLGVLWDEPALLSRAADAAARIDSLIPEDEGFDITIGAAGAIATLLGLYRVAPTAALLRTAVACGAHLIDKAQPAPTGIAWPCIEEVLAPLTGFAHGAAGIAWALSKLASVSGQALFEVAAQQALAYERASFVPGQGWPDWRKLGGASLARPTFETAWCHGAPGIGVSRLPLVERGDALARQELRAALEVTQRQPLAPDHSLCHGDLGNIELFVEAARVLGESGYRAEAERRAAVLLNSVEREGPLCGIPLECEVPGLMTGIAGIGYGLLRLAEPARVPSVLLLSPPPASQG